MNILKRNDIFKEMCAHTIMVDIFSFIFLYISNPNFNNIIPFTSIYDLENELLARTHTQITYKPLCESRREIRASLIPVIVLRLPTINGFVFF